MQEAATGHRVQHQRTQSSNKGLNTSNATSNHYLGGQPRPWMESSQPSLGSEQYRPPEIIERQAERLNRLVEYSVDSREIQALGSGSHGAQLPQQANSAIEHSLDTERYGTNRLSQGLSPSTNVRQTPQAMMNVETLVNHKRTFHAQPESSSMHGQPNKQRRLDMHVQGEPLPTTGNPVAPLYSFVGPPPWPVYFHSAPALASSPLAMTPIFAPPNARQLHMAPSPYPASGSRQNLSQHFLNHSQASNPTLSQLPFSTQSSVKSMHRRHANNLSRSASQVQMSATQSGVSGATQQKHTSQQRPPPSATDSPSQLATQSNIGHPTILSQISRLNLVMRDPHTRDSFRDWGHQRVILLEEACNSQDWFYLTLHQVYCLRSLNRAEIGQLGIADARDAALTSLEAILIRNSKLQRTALEWFSQFPIHSTDLLRGTCSEAFHALKQVHMFLDKMAPEWPNFCASCLAREYPPSPYELYSRLAMPSTVLQTVFFTYTFRQIEDGANQAWMNSAIHFFKLTQSQLINKMNETIRGLSKEPLHLDSGLAQYASEYFALRNRNVTTQVRSMGEPASGPNMVESLPIGSTGSPLRHSNSMKTMPVPAMQRTGLISRTRANFVPSSAGSALSTGVFSGLNTGVSSAALSQSLAQPQPVPLNGTQTLRSIGPRQQELLQNMTGDTSVPRTSIGTSDQRISSLSVASSHATAKVSSHLEPRPQISPGVQIQLKNGRAAIRAALQARSSRPPIANSGPLIPPKTHVAQQTNRLIPPAGRIMAPSTHPNPDLGVLHQARLLSPEPRVQVTQNQPLRGGRLFQVLQRFVLPPQLITQKQSYYNWQINIAAADLSHKANDVPIQANRQASKIYREFNRGSILYRLRCILMTGSSQSVPNESEWSTSATNWPNSCFVSLNESDIALRRKTHFGKNLPCDLMSGIRAGINSIEISIHFGPEEVSHAFAVAVEQIETFDQPQCTQQLTLIEKHLSLASIVASIQPPDFTSDDEITIVDSHLSIDLIDPFTAQVWKTPVRGNTCTHRECFDLQAFLESRPDKFKGVPLSSADEWKCPICNRDARPRSLVLDGFLLSVSKDLLANREHGEDVEEVRAIQVTAGGKWKAVLPKNDKTPKPPQREIRSRDGPVAGPGTSQRSTPSKEAVMRETRMEETVVIELDDG